MLSKLARSAVPPAARLSSTYQTVRCIGSGKHANPFDGPHGQYPNHSNKVNPPANISSSPVKNSDLDAMFNNKNLKKRYVPIQLRQTGDGKGESGEGIGVIALEFMEFLASSP